MTKTLHCVSLGMVGVFGAMLLGNLATYKTLTAGVTALIVPSYLAIAIFGLVCVMIAKSRKGWQFRRHDAIGAALPAIALALAWSIGLGLGIWTGAAS